jgi:hypothetical protein
MSAARQTRGRLNMQPPGLNIYAEHSCTENARFCRSPSVPNADGQGLTRYRRRRARRLLACWGVILAAVRCCAV